MRHLAHAAPLLLLAACGGSSGPRPPLYGGFAPAGGTAIVFPATTCDIAFVGTTGISGLSITLADFPEVCAFRTDTALCGSRANTTFVTALAVDGVVNGSAPAIGQGTYPYLPNPPTGAFRASIASAVKTTDTCGSQPGSKVGMEGGQIVISSITLTNVTGTLTLDFSDGTSFDQPFDLARCAPPTDLCVFFDASRCFPGVTPWTCVTPVP